MDVPVTLTPISDFVEDRSDGRIAWVVQAVFATAPNIEPRCVDYRARVVPRALSPVGDPTNARYVLDQMTSAAITVDDLDLFDAFPRAGIPLYVYEVASQARLLERMRQWMSDDPERFAPSMVEALAHVEPTRGGKSRIGRPPKLELAERLAVLADVERGYASGRKRAEVAKDHHMSDSSLRDLIHWARKVADPPLFTDPGAGRKGGRLTDYARRLIERKDGDQR